MSEENKNLQPADNSSQKTSMGIDENVASLLCYLGTWVTGLIFFLIEKDNKVVRFHAAQSIVTFGILFVVGLVIGWIPFIGWLINLLIWPISVVLWIILMIKAFKGEMFKLPIASKYAEQLAQKQI